MVEIGVKAVEHALRFLPQDNSARRLVEERLAGLRNGNAKRLIASIKPETKYSQESCIRRASSELLKFSVSEKWISGMALTGQVFFPCADAGSFVDLAESEKESRWQDETLYPLIEKAFEEVRNAEKTLAA